MSRRSVKMTPSVIFVKTNNANLPLSKLLSPFPVFASHSRKMYVDFLSAPHDNHLHYTPRLFHGHTLTLFTLSAHPHFRNWSELEEGRGDCIGREREGHFCCQREGEGASPLHTHGGEEREIGSAHLNNQVVVPSKCMYTATSEPRGRFRQN